MKLSMVEPVHETACRVLYGDTDAGGVVYYGNYMRYFERGRTEFMRELDLPYCELEARGVILPVTECYARYKASAKYDDLVIIRTSLAEVKKVSCRFHYRILKQNSGKKETLLAKGFTVHAAVNKAGKLIRLPEDFLARIRELCPEVG